MLSKQKISFKKVWKSKGPRIDPCGTPAMIFSEVLNDPINAAINAYSLRSIF